MEHTDRVKTFPLLHVRGTSNFLTMKGSSENTSIEVSIIKKFLFYPA